MNRRFEEQAAAVLSRYQMLAHCDRVVVGFSGGADSTALLHYLHSHFSGTVVAAHVNHHLRGAESDRDEQFVRGFCAEHHIPLEVKQADIALLAKQRGQSIEECGRAVRYDFFASLLKGENDRIATAHTLSDNAETVLFHLTRGTGSRGLCGIPAVRGSIIRPLTGVTRQAVEEYCARHHLPYVEDSTNRSTDYTRNKLRLQVMPVLREINPDFLQAIERTARQLAEQEEAVALLGQQAMDSSARQDGFDLASLRQYPKAAVQQGVLQELRSRGVGGKITDQKMQSIYDCILSGRGGVTITGALEVRAEQGLLLFVSPKAQAAEWEIPLSLPQTIEKMGKQIAVELISPQNCKINENNLNLLFHNGVDYDTIQNGAVWRTRQAGDTFRPQGRNVTKSLKKLLQEGHVPPSKRDKILLLAAGSTVVWAEGFGAAEGYSITADTRRAAQITVKEIAPNATGY